MTDRELMQQALGYMESVGQMDMYPEEWAIVVALRERLAQPEQEPVAWIDEFGNVFPLGAQRGPKHLNEPMKPLYTAPPQQAEPVEPVAWEDVLGAIARGWTHDDNRHKTMDVQLAVAIAKEIQDMVIAQRTWVGLTDEEIHRTTVAMGFNHEWTTEIGVAHAIVRNLEAKLKERNT